MSIQDIVKRLIQQEGCDVRLALIQYRDHPPQDHSYVTKSHDFTDSALQMRQWLDKATASGGGDEPEAVADALYEVLSLSWRPKATKLCILLCDAPPHGLCRFSADGFHNGCPKGHDPVILASSLAQNEIVLYCIGCEPDLKTWKHFYIALASSTGGQYLPLTKAPLIANIIIGGAQEELSLKEVEEEAENDLLAIQAELEGKGGLTDDILAEELAARLNMRGRQSTQLLVRDDQNGVINQIPDDAQNLMQCSDLQQMRKKFRARVYKTDGHRRFRPMPSSRSRLWLRSRTRSRSWSRSRSRSRSRLRSRLTSCSSSGSGSSENDSSSRDDNGTCQETSRRRRRRRRRSRSRSRTRPVDNDQVCNSDDDSDFEKDVERVRARSRSRSPDNYYVSIDKVGLEQARRLIQRSMKRKENY